ncbi:MAG: transglutaminase domain-containing protein, partial [Ramlibacter sp.]|nr:transglutaminase domain-containing protein [Cryobacterium sp.]
MTAPELRTPAPRTPGPRGPEVGRPAAPARLPAGPSRRGAADWPLSVAVLALLLIAQGALGPLLLGTGWWWLMTMVTTVVLLGSAALRRLGVAAALVPLAGVGILLATLTLVFGAGTGLLWLVPSLDTLDRFRELSASGAVSIEQQGTPADAVPGILFLLCVGAGLLAIVAYLLAVTARMPALAGLPALVPLLVPGLIRSDGADAAALALAGAAYLALLGVEVRMGGAGQSHRPPGRPRAFAPGPGRVPGPLGGALGVGGVSLAAALVLSVAVPVFPGSGYAARPSSTLLFGNGVSPMINLGEDLRRPEAWPVLHYRTTATRPPYLRLLTLDEFSGRNWTSGLVPADTSNTVDDIALPPGMSTDVATTETRTNIVVDDLSARWLPIPAPARSITGLVGGWYWNGPAGSVSSPNDTTRGQQYTVTALSLAPTRDQLRRSGGAYPAGVERSLRLPADNPPRIEQTAREVTAGTDTAYDAALALQTYLRGDDFSYDTEAPAEDGYDGGGVDVVSTFLEVKKGYCVHFSSAMAVMARSIGIPARIAVGYQPGTLSASSSIAGIGRYSVDSHDLHAWPELYFAGVGWVPFEPTPGRGALPEYTRSAGGSQAPGGPGGAAESAPPGGAAGPTTNDPGARGGAADAGQEP